MFVDGSSMLPSLQPGQLFIINRLAYPGWGMAPHRGDVIVFRRRIPGNDAFLVKRVIGVPGDEVQVVAGNVFVNGTRIDEPYVAATDDYSYPIDGGPTRVPDASYFVLGDNRPVSVDSHQGWFVPADDVIGEVSPLPIDVPVLALRASA
jgi:signal peptidase I